MSEQHVAEPARRTPVTGAYDVIVVGGGMSGCSAAVAAARSGANTLLVERWGFLGGTATAAMVGCICGLYTCGPTSTQQQLVFGQLSDLMGRLEDRNAGFKYRHRYQVEHESLKLVLDEWLLESGVSLLLQVFVADVLMEGNTVRGIVVEGKGGRKALLCGVVIDSSGDADVTFYARGAFDKGDLLQAPTYVFYMGGVDIDRAMAFPEEEMKALLKRVVDSGDYDFPRISGSYSPSPKPGTVHVNMTRTPGVDGTDPVSLTNGHIEGRRQIGDFATFLKEHVPGFEAAYLDSVASQLGIRETRRITGEHILTRDDVLGARKFEDAICRSSWPIEDHTHGLDTVRLHLEGDDYYHIPYRCLVPVKVDNLLVTGRCISATRGASASVRVMAPGMATGQAAGTAAQMALAAGIPPRALSAQALQERLRMQGGLI